MLLFIVGASLFRYAGQLLWGWNDVQTEVLTFACLDSLAAGALLAWWHRSDEGRTRRIAGILAMTVLPLWFVTTGVAANAVPSLAFVSRPLTAPALGAIVYNVAHGRLGRFGSVLLWRPLVYLGRISYGMYMFHLFVPLAVRRVLRDLFAVTAMNRGVLIAAYTVVTVIAASLSWHFFESKINNLKTFFPYVATDSPAGAAGLQPEPGSRAD
jgi:peptidoglycan/LPS O-acetylase OafA/YrhL